MYFVLGRESQIGNLILTLFKVMGENCMQIKFRYTLQNRQNTIISYC